MSEQKWEMPNPRQPLTLEPDPEDLVIDRLRAEIERLTAYVRHKPECSLRKMKVFRTVPGHWENDDLYWRKEQIDGPGDTCTCGLITLEKDA